jgi:DNA-binding transcriptional LysR family regulator
MELREVRAFIAVVEEGGLSAAARRLHLSQPAISQTISALERQLGVQLLVRSSSGVRPTEAGLTLLAEARTLVDRHDYAVAAVTQRGEESSVLRLGIPLELPADLLTRPVTELAAAYPHTRIQARHLSTCEQLMALYTQNLDVGLLRERPVGQALDAVLLTEEHLGVLLPAKEAVEIVEPNGVRLDALSGLSWVGFPRSGSPAWYDEVTAVLRSHGVDPGGRIAGQHSPDRGGEARHSRCRGSLRPCPAELVPTDPRGGELASTDQQSPGPAHLGGLVGLFPQARPGPFHRLVRGTDLPRRPAVRRPPAGDGRRTCRHQTRCGWAEPSSSRTRPPATSLASPKSISVLSR